jgi:RHS repeat-associated protein
VGNIAQVQHQAVGGSFVRSLALAPGNNRLATVTLGQTVYDYTYDPNGNLIQETTSRHYEWDFTDRMKVYRTQTGNAEPSIHTHYLYDAGGQRVKKLARTQGGQAEVTIYIDGVFEHHRLTQAGSTQENNSVHVMDNQSRIALVRVGAPFANDSSPAVGYHLGDHLGSSNLVVDDAGAWVNREEYLPYGETSFGSFARKRYRFTGKERDEESGLCYHGARYYATWLGRWVSCDPKGMMDGVVSYSYAKNNPLGFKDLTGTQAVNPFQLDPSLGELPNVGYKPQQGLPAPELLPPVPVEAPFSARSADQEYQPPPTSPDPVLPAAEPRQSEYDRMFCGGRCRPGQAEEGQRWGRSLGAIETASEIYLGSVAAVPLISVLPGLVPGLGGKALAGGVSSGWVNFATQQLRGTEMKDTNVSSLLVSAALGAAGTALGSYMYGEGGPFEWVKGDTVSSNLLKFADSQVIWFGYGNLVVTPANSFVNGTSKRNEMSLSLFDFSFAAARALGWNLAGAYWPEYGVGKPFQIMTDKFVLSIGQKVASGVLFPQAGPGQQKQDPK